MSVANRRSSRASTPGSTSRSDREDRQDSATTNRIDDLNEVLDNFERVHTEWVEADNRPDPDSDYWDGVEALIDTFNNGDLPGSMRDMNDLVQVLSMELTAFDNRDDENDQMPGDEFFEAVQGIFKGRQQKLRDEQPFYIESVKELHDQKVPNEQIARMYGWVDAWGRPETRKVREELDNPGTHVNDNWIHPEELKRRQRLDNQRRRRDAAVTTAVARKVQKSKPVCPESCHQLWEQGVSAEQTAKMLDRPLKEIKQEFADFEEEAADRNKDLEKKRKQQREAQRLRELTGGRVGGAAGGAIGAGGDGGEADSQEDGDATEVSAHGSIASEAANKS